MVFNARQRGQRAGRPAGRPGVRQRRPALHKDARERSRQARFTSGQSVSKPVSMCVYMRVMEGLIIRGLSAAAGLISAAAGFRVRRRIRTARDLHIYICAVVVYKERVCKVGYDDDDDCPVRSVERFFLISRLDAAGSFFFILRLFLCIGFGRDSECSRFDMATAEVQWCWKRRGFARSSL